MSNHVLDLYRKLFARRRFYKFNELLFHVSLRGLGVLNYQNDRISGEAWFIDHIVGQKPNLLVLDVGANEGGYANRIRQRSPSAVIHAFEPHPRTYKQLAEAAAHHGYTSHNVGLGEEHGEMELFDYAGEGDGSQHASLYKDVIEQIHQGTATATQVHIVTVDAFLDQRNIQHVDLLKIDTEGHELKVLVGAKRAIAEGRIDCLHIEFNEMNVVSRVFFKDLYDLLPGYAFFRMLPDGLAPLGAYRPLTYEIFAFQNIVARRRE
ncbi:MAG: FkbM family methyltransferase [Chloroflexota bacterium]|nr:FkbM family methyltransferase [Chloroflexota bacterium]